MVPSLTSFVGGTTVITQDIANTFDQGCDNFAQLRAFAPQGPLQVYARGQSAPNDGGQGTFWWNGGLSNPVDDNFTVIVPSGSSAGAWVRISFDANPSAFYLNGSTLNASAANAGQVVWGAGTIDLPASSSVGSKFVLYFAVTGQGNAIITVTPAGSDTINGSGNSFAARQGFFGVITTDGTGDWFISSASFSTDNVTIQENASVLSIVPTARQYQSALLATPGPGTWTTPSTITSSTQFKVTLQGGGGGGGGCGATANYIGGSGSAGGTTITVFTGLSASTGYTIGIGAGGTGGSSGANAGGQGGNSLMTVGATTVTAYGGAAGAAGGTTAQKIASFSGGTPDGTLFNIVGAYGLSSLGTGGGIARGGSCFFGQGGVTDLSGGASAGLGGFGYGSGGSGGFAAAAGTAEAGAAGAQGFILIEWIGP